MHFRFRFQALLNQRDYHLKTAQTALATAQLKQDQIEAGVQKVLDEMRLHRQLWEKRQQEGMSAVDHLTFKEYLASLEQQLLLLEKRLEQASFEVSRRRQIVTERDKEVKILENLRDREKEAFRYEQALLEQKQLDDMAVSRFQDRIDLEKD